MNVTKSQIINGFIKYAKAEIINKIIDKPLRMILAAGISALEVNPLIADSIFENSFIAKVFNEQAGYYNLDSIFEIIEKTIDEYGDFPITIPAIKFISPTEKELSFNSRDIHKLKAYISGGVYDD